MKRKAYHHTELIRRCLEHLVVYLIIYPAIGLALIFAFVDKYLLNGYFNRAHGGMPDEDMRRLYDKCSVMVFICAVGLSYYAVKNALNVLALPIYFLAYTSISKFQEIIK